MKRIFTILIAALTITSGTIFNNPALAAEQPNIMIMGEDGDRDSVPRNSRVFKRVLNALANQLHDEGFDVFDETALTLDNYVQGRIRRSDDEIIDIARSVDRPPIDVAVIFGIYASSNRTSYTTKIRTRIEGRMLNVRSGQRLGNFEVDIPRAFNAPHDCNRECLLETVGRKARSLSQDLGAVLTEKLAYMVDRGRRFASENRNSYLPTAYRLAFSGFNEDDIDGIEEYIVAFKGYIHHRPTNTSKRHADYWYETDSGSARLNRNLRRMLDHLGVRGRVSFAGNTFNVDKITFRSRR
tara:strand:+ start:11228 stop:12118 length:891 start_codon:yes stop_codon:yes gene_type:complete